MVHYVLQRRQKTDRATNTDIFRNGPFQESLLTKFECTL